MKDLEKKVDVVIDELKTLNKIVGTIAFAGVVLAGGYTISNVQGCMRDRAEQITNQKTRPDLVETLTYVDTNGNRTYDHLKIDDKMIPLGGAFRDLPLEIEGDQILRERHNPPYTVVDLVPYSEYVKWSE